MEPRPDPERAFAEFRRSGDPRALGEVYDRLAPELLRLALHLTHDAAEAEDVLQATFLAAIEGARRFDPARRVLPWLVGILSLEAKRARERLLRQPDPRRLERAASPDPRDSAAQAELLEHLDQGLARLPTAFRPVLSLRLRHGLSVPEIAAVLERSPGTVRSQLARATERLRQVLPAGLAGALQACDRPTRGLAAVRAAVVEHAALQGAPAAGHPSAGPVTAATTLGGLVTMKALTTAAVALLAAFSLWYVTRPAPSRAGPRQVELSSPSASLAATHPPAPDTPAAEPGPQREEVRSAPAPAPANRFGLVVHARWADDTPAAGEVVLVAPLEARGDESSTGTTGSDGSARFDELEPNRFRVRLLRGGEETVRFDGRADAEVTLAIRAGVTVEGRVRDATGEPVPGAEIWLSERYLNNLGHVVLRADREGAFTLRALGPDHYVGARKAGFAPSALRSVRGAPGDRLGLELVLAEAGASVAGIVVDEAGQPISQACVLLGVERPASVRLEDGSFSPAAPPQRARTDAHGRFELPAVALGPQPIQARAPGFAPLADTLAVLPGGTHGCRLVLERAARLVGSVHDARGQPIAGAWLQLGAPELFASASAWSGLDGRFELGGIPRGTQLVRASHPEHGAAQHELRFAPGAREEWAAVLVPTARIEGQIVDAHGSPLAGLVVIALEDGDREHRTRSERSDAEGRFVLSGLADRPHRLWVQAPLGWREFPLAEAEQVRPGDPPLLLRIPSESERGRLTLAVTTPEGEPLAGAELNVWHAEEGIWRSFVSAGACGAIRAENVPPGTLDLELRHPEYPWKTLAAQRIEAGATLDLGKVALDPAGRLRVHLGGLPEERYASLSAVLVNDANRESAVARLAPGLLSAGPLAPGEHQLVLGGDGVCQVRAPFTIVAGVETELTLTLQPCGTRDVRLILPTGRERASRLSCSLHAADGRLVWRGSADCALDPPVVRASAPAGWYRLEARGAGALTGSLALELPPAGLDLPPLVLSLVWR